tara:strand:+ start:16249 stop:17031 length:783 start_codon:yes stop_codon:yes gene_type:complete
MNSILDKIKEYKVREVEEKKETAPLDIKSITYKNKVRPFKEAIKNTYSKGKIPLICEIKKASPSRGVIRDDFNVTAIAKDYAKGGATCISVLTDYPSFKGKDEYIRLVRNACDLPILRKDFFIDPYQVYEAKHIGADCILIIMAMLDNKTADLLFNLSKDIKIDSIFEVHNESEYDRAIELGAEIIGINNRNLHNFETNIQNTISIAKKFDNSKIIISESGIFDKKDIAKLSQYGVHGYLIGESIMKSDNIVHKIKELIN